MHFRTGRVLAGGCGWLLLLLGGCGGGPKPTDEVVILCGGSFRPPMEKVVQLYQESGGRAVLSFGQSEDLLPQIKQKAAGDLFVSHDPFVQYTTDAGAMARYVVVGHMAPVLVVAKGNPKKLARFEDLAQPGLKVVLPDPAFSTCGKMVFALLEKKKIKDAVLKNVGSALVRSHHLVGEHIKLGDREAGIMWNGVAKTWQEQVEVIPTPYEYAEEIRAAVMGLSYSKRPDQVEKFLKFVDARGAEVFAEFGYVK